MKSQVISRCSFHLRTIVLDVRTLQLSTTNPFCLQRPADFTQFSVCVNMLSWGTRVDEGQNDKETGEKQRKAVRKKKKLFREEMFSLPEIL